MGQDIADTGQAGGVASSGGRSSPVLHAHSPGTQAWRRFTSASRSRPVDEDTLSVSKGSQGFRQSPRMKEADDASWAADISWDMLTAELEPLAVTQSTNEGVDGEIRVVELNVGKASATLGRLRQTAAVLQVLESSPSKIELSHGSMTLWRVIGSEHVREEARWGHEDLEEFFRKLIRKQWRLSPLPMKVLQVQMWMLQLQVLELDPVPDENAMEIVVPSDDVLKALAEADARTWGMASTGLRPNLVSIPVITEDTGVSPDQTRAGGGRRKLKAKLEVLHERRLNASQDASFKKQSSKSQSSAEPKEIEQIHIVPQFYYLGIYYVRCIKEGRPKNVRLEVPKCVGIEPGGESDGLTRDPSSGT
ncbi:hypothetical protein R1sor_002379 [Riccia sorocarpa]|uniref:Uncharacterized protein n=1 Tax=Riccia sorocarpa TaxID=122646 RepID=A0ABD3H199_9MARC